MTDRRVFGKFKTYFKSIFSLFFLLLASFSKHTSFYLFTTISKYTIFSNIHFQFKINSTIFNNFIEFYWFILIEPHDWNVRWQLVDHVFVAHISDLFSMDFAIVMV